jgi:hypothetical protein
MFGSRPLGDFHPGGSGICFREASQEIGKSVCLLLFGKQMDLDA